MQDKTLDALEDSIHRLGKISIKIATEIEANNAAVNSIDEESKMISSSSETLQQSISNILNRTR